MSGRDLSPVLDWRGAIAASDLSMAQKSVAHALANYMNSRGGSAFPALMTLAGDASCAKSTVVESLRVLEDRGFLIKQVGGGRGRRSSYQALIPGMVASADRSGALLAGGDVPHDGSSGPLPAAAGPASRSALSPLERVGSADSLGGETVRLTGVKGRPGGLKGRLSGTEVDHEVDQEIDQAAAAAAADLEDLTRRLNSEVRAADLLQGLDDLEAPTRLRQVALADPDRAIAWLEVTRSDAYLNECGFFFAGMNSGEWPSARGGSLPGVTEYDRCRGWIDKTGVLLQLEDAQHHLERWEDLGEVERGELSDLLDEAWTKAHPAAAEAAA